MSEFKLLNDLTNILVEALAKTETFEFRFKAWLKQRQDDRREDGSPTINNDFDTYGQFYRPKEEVDTSKMSPADKLKHKINDKDRK